MKKVYTIEERVLNGTVTVRSEVSCFASYELAKEVRRAAMEQNGFQDPSGLKYFCSEVKETVVYETAEEVPLLNPPDDPCEMLLEDGKERRLCYMVVSGGVDRVRYRLSGYEGMTVGELIGCAMKAPWFHWGTIRVRDVVNNLWSSDWKDGGLKTETMSDGFAGILGCRVLGVECQSGMGWADYDIRIYMK